jgi:hypothetical protein
MAFTVEALFWRAITAADFFNIERARKYAPAGGGGQSYISISFRGLSHAELGEFLGVTPPAEIRDTRPAVTLDSVGVVYDETLSSPLTFSARYRPPQADDRYRIARQNRQYQHRHPAWTAQFGFPQAPDYITASHDPRMPDLSLLKVFVAKLAGGDYVAGYFNTAVAPLALAHIQALDVLWQPYNETRSAGVIDLEGTSVTVDDLGREASPEGDLAETAPEVLEAVDETRIAAGKPPSGQGLRSSAEERLAIEKRAILVTTEYLKREGWAVADVGLYRPYDLHCVRKSAELRVEVKGTTGDGSAVLLTPGEVSHARDNSNTALMVVSGINLSTDDDGHVIAEGGQLQVLNPWVIDDHGTLKATGYEYTLSETQD